MFQNKSKENLTLYYECSHKIKTKEASIMFKMETNERLLIKKDKLTCKISGIPYDAATVPRN